MFRLAYLLPILLLSSPASACWKLTGFFYGKELNQRVNHDQDFSIQQDFHILNFRVSQKQVLNYSIVRRVNKGLEKIDSGTILLVEGELKKIGPQLQVRISDI